MFELTVAQAEKIAVKLSGLSQKDFEREYCRDNNHAEQCVDDIYGYDAFCWAVYETDFSAFKAHVEMLLEKTLLEDLFPVLQGEMLK